MNMRGLLGVLFAAGSLVVGAITACLTAVNRARGAQLDERQHTCETNWRRNELLREGNAVAEWRLLCQEEELGEEPQVVPVVRIEH